jgi:hypothetical protein
MAIIAGFVSSCVADKSGLPDSANAAYTYQPLTAGSTWVYKNTDSLTVDTNTITMTSSTQTVGNNIFHLATSLENGSTDQGYYGINHHLYTMTDQQLGFQLTYLDDTKPVGGTWGISYSDSTGTLRLTGTTIEKNINHTVLGKTYNNVIHTRLTFQLTIPADPAGSLGMSGYFTSDFYIAANIGIIEIDDHSSIDNSKTELISSQIK